MKQPPKEEEEGFQWAYIETLTSVNSSKHTTLKTSQRTICVLKQESNYEGKM